MSLKFRNNQVYLSNEVYSFLAAMAKALVKGTDASITVDQFTDNYLRDKITNDYPELVGLQAEMETKKQEARKQYGKVEEAMVEAIRRGN